MTFREKLKQEHPECVIGKKCIGCPKDYGYEPRTNGCPDCGCEEHWNKEMEEDKDE